jgi:hypothetical protein
VLGTTILSSSLENSSCVLLLLLRKDATGPEFGTLLERLVLGGMIPLLGEDSKTLTSI